MITIEPHWLMMFGWISFVAGLATFAAFSFIMDKLP